MCASVLHRQGSFMTLRSSRMQAADICMVSNDTVRLTLMSMGVESATSRSRNSSIICSTSSSFIAASLAFAGLPAYASDVIILYMGHLCLPRISTLERP
ncbi:hypothetical protein AUEXF2481DRAFT_327170 [Aureobasidium subglaciale EXF-2481]|uniref:Uncharacterized protein n=1 Tax=Aureobasidium subglaciale (strain EXF-2481) TaxID=1043005 RepID=A0A074Z3H3_AURSE|nr:uncharacterized protein AUEXF2481DRAFT_327170 [Aureobasidium subglaciale EXF-2481]KEQ93571.1 hypothetical protein AUEXF2481DRAFT_327170 [Aureobasidium subglaciale EXF-2481]